MHGDEPIGVNALRALEQKRNDFDWVIGNPKALKIGERCFEGDLNRSAPGNPSSSVYEERRASELIELSKSYDYTIDIHGSTKVVGCFIIITNLTKENLNLTCLFDIPNIVYWPPFSSELEGTVSEYFECGIEIEVGPQDSPEMQRLLKEYLENFMEDNESKQEIPLSERLKSKKIYEVYDSQKESLQGEFREFTEVTIGDETFLPLLINSYKERNGIQFYKMRQIMDVNTHPQLR